jgi:tRNA-dihydrouridine synthase B
LTVILSEAKDLPSIYPTTKRGHERTSNINCDNPQFTERARHILGTKERLIDATYSSLLPAEYRVRDLSIRPATVLAPMAGVTDTLFRRVIRGLGGCGLLMTEFTSSEGITRSAKKAEKYLYFQDDEHPIAAQLFGANPQVMADAARMVEDLGYDAVDINLGCPAKKVVKCGGSGLLRELPLLDQIFRSVRAAVKIPLTIKLRAGWDENSIVAKEVVKLAEDGGVEAAAIHPRTRLQGYSGKADWNIIAEVKQVARIPIIGNGDIQCPEDAARMVKETGCDAVMIGRAAATNPWIFAQMNEFRETGHYSTPTEEDRHRLLSGYYRQILNSNAPDSMGKMKQFACWFTHGVGNGSELRRIVHLARTPAEVVDNVERFFERKAALGGNLAHEPDPDHREPSSAALRT